METLDFILSEMESLEGFQRRHDKISHQLGVRGAYEVLVALVMLLLTWLRTHPTPRDAEQRVSFPVAHSVTSLLSQSKCDSWINRCLYVAAPPTVFENKDKIVIIMEYASKGELYDFISERRRLSERETRHFFRQIVSAVHYCHKVPAGQSFGWRHVFVCLFYIIRVMSVYDSTYGEFTK